MICKPGYIASHHSREEQSDHRMNHPPFNVLVFSKTKGYRHESIPAGIVAIRQLAEKSHNSSTPFSVEATEDSSFFNQGTLSGYSVIVFLQASGEFFDDVEQLNALTAFVRNGGGVVGIHCASTGLPSSEWYGRMIGGVFTEHPDPQWGKILVKDASHPILATGTALAGIPKAANETTLIWDWHDEWYNFKTNPRSGGVHVLLTVEESSYKGGSLGDDHPIAWCQKFEGGRSFYTGLGHFDEAYRDERFLGQILNGILWTAGRLDIY